MEFSKVTNFFSDLLGNPFSTPSGQLIEKATDASQASEDWALYMEICDVINSTEDGPRDAVRALRKQISNNVGKSNIAIMYTLTVLETCVKNCDKRFHVLVAQKEFLQELVRLAMPKNNPPHFILDKVLGLIQTWADAFRDEPELKEFVAVYEELKEKGCEFPMTDLDNIPPIHTPARSVPEVRPENHSEMTMASRGMDVVRRPGDGAAPPVCAVSSPVVLNVDQLAKLRSELDVVLQNCHVFGDMLTEQTPGQEPADDWSLMKELNETCNDMQKRIVKLIETVQNEDVTGELLHVNDQLNNAALRFERYERMRGGATASAGVASLSLLPSVPCETASDSCPMGAPYPTGLQTGPLLDLDSGSQTATAPSPHAAMSTVNGSGTEEPEFDMFAQSRHTFDQNQPRDNRSAYHNQEEDQAPGGLASAVTMKSRGMAYKEEDVDEMEQWLRSTESTEASKVTATSSEFDAFLATKEAGNDEATATQTSNRGGRTLQNTEEEQALFSL